MEGLGICDEGRGGRWIDENGPERNHVNMSGGGFPNTLALSSDMCS